MFQSVGTLYQVSYDIQKNCRVGQLNYDLMGFCLNSSNNCSISSIANNLQASIFKITGAANKIVEVLVDTYSNFGSVDITDLSTAQNTFSGLGSSIGSLSRTVLGFTATSASVKPPKPKPSN